MWIEISEGRKVPIEKLFEFCIQRKRIRKLRELLGREGKVDFIETIQFYARYKLETSKSIGKLFAFLE